MSIHSRAGICGAGSSQAIRNRTELATRLLHAFVVLAFLLAWSGIALAQFGGTGTIQGTAKDSSGAVIPGATVTVTEVSTSTKRTAQTTGAGYYSIPALSPGEYTVSVTAPGFQSVTQPHVIVDALAIVPVNFALPIGAASENLVVTAAAPMLDTQDATLGLSMRNELYTALPLAMNGTARDPTAFVSLVPGVQATSTQAAGTSFASINGGQGRLNEVYIEGMPTTNAAVQGETRNLSESVSVEAVDSFQVETNNPPAMYQGQGVENYTLKSGGNKFHGSAYEYFRNTALDAAGYFSRNGTPVEHQNEFGASVGGPVIKDKLFFFANFDGYYYRAATNATLQTVPTLAERKGDFSAFPEPIYDPLTTTCNANGANCTRAQFAGNIIPTSRLSPVSQSLQSYLPAPINDQLQNNVLTNQPTGLHIFTTTDRMDYHASNKNLVYAIFTRGQYFTDGLAGISAGTDALPLPYTASRIVDEIPTAAQVHDVYSISPNLINQFGYAFSRLQVPILSATESGKYPQKAGLQGLPNGQANTAFPTVNFSGPNSPIGWAGTNSIAFNDASNTYVAQDNLQWVHGKHAITFGGQIQWLQNNDTAPDGGSDATFNTSNAETAGFSPTGTLLNTEGNAYASYLTGAIASAGVVDNFVATTGERFRNYALYVQDDAKLTQRLSVNLGLRYDIFGVATEAHDRMSFLNPTLPNPAVGGYPGALQFAGNGPDSCHCSTPVKTHYLGFGPRIGAEYALDSKTVLRAGYAIMYARAGAVGGALYQGTGQLGYDANPSFNSSSPGNGFPAFFWSQQPSLPPVYSSIYQGGLPAYQHPPFYDPTLNTGYCTGCAANGKPGGGINYGDPVIGGRPPMYENWTAGIQREITPNLTFTLAYSASAGHYLPSGLGRPIYSNQINPVYLALGPLLSAPATPANIAAANAIAPGVKLPYSNFAGSIGQALRPFPQYAGVNDQYGDIANSTYNSMQVILRKQLSQGLSFNASYVWSKEIDNVSSARTAYNHQAEKAVGGIDRPNIVAASFAYALPFGRGHRFGGGNAVVSHLVDNFQLSGIYTFSSGGPLSIVSSGCNAPYTGGECIPNRNPAFSGPVKINGGPSSGSGIPGTTSYINKNAFLVPAPYTFGTLTRNLPFGLRAPSVADEDLTLRRVFGITDRFKLNLAVDAFNLFNIVRFGGVSTNINSSNFGTVTNQANSARKLQLDARISF